MAGLFSKLHQHPSVTIDRVIMGLGNPGKQYANNRHNLGFMVIDRIAELRRLQFYSGNGPYLWATDTLSDNGNVQNVCFAKPLTYMNSSGVAAREILRQFDLSPERLLVVYDDIDLPLGRLRIRPNGSAGGHKGVKSIGSQLQTEKFPRLRLGIGPQGDGVSAEDFVLADFNKDEQRVLADVIEKSTEIIFDYLQSDIDTIMNKYNPINFREKNTGII